MKSSALLSIAILLCGCTSPAKVSSEDATLASQTEEFRRLEARISRSEDVLFDTLRGTHVRLIGMVKSPGVFNIQKKQDYTLDDLIKDAYGFEVMAAVRRVKIVRDSDYPDRKKSYEVDMSEQGIREGNGRFGLKAGDVVYVPERLGM